MADQVTVVGRVGGLLRALVCAIAANVLALVIVVVLEIAYLPTGLALAICIAAVLMVAVTHTRRTTNALVASATAVVVWLAGIVLEAL
jgi:hypothetical protein